MIDAEIVDDEADGRRPAPRLDGAEKSVLDGDDLLSGEPRRGQAAACDRTAAPDADGVVRGEAVNDAPAGGGELGPKPRLAQKAEGEDAEAAARRRLA